MSTTPHGYIGMENPSLQGPSPRCGRCLWPSSPLGACYPLSAWALCQSGWEGKEKLLVCVNYCFYLSRKNIFSVPEFLSLSSTWANAKRVHRMNPNSSVANSKGFDR